MARFDKYLIAIIFLALAVTFFQFSQLPRQMAPDEVEFSRVAISLDNQAYQPYSPEATGHATLYFYILLVFFKIFGTSLFALRLPAALFGVLSVVVFYYLCCLVFANKRLRFLPLSFIAAFIFVTLRWHINFSRFAFEATFLLFLELVSTLFFFLYFKNKKWYWLVMSSIFAGLAFNSYTPGRIFIIIPLFILLVKEKNLQIQHRVLNLALCLIPLVVLAAPLILTFTQMKDHRVNEEFIFNAVDLTTSQKYTAVLSNAWSNFTMLFYKGDMNGRHNYPGKAALNPILALFFLIGLWYMIKKKKYWYDFYFLLYFVISFVPTILSHPHGNPNMLRTFTATPTVVYFITLGLQYLSMLKIKRYKKYIPLVILMFVILSSLYELRTYFVHQAHEMKYTFEIRKSFDWLKERGFILTPEAYKY